MKRVKYNKIFCKVNEHTISMSVNPLNTRFFNNSHPIPPAPTTNILAAFTAACKSPPRALMICSFL